MNRYLGTYLAGFIALTIAFANPLSSLGDGPSEGKSNPSALPSGISATVQRVIDTVLEQHIDPPARQQMLLTGLKALYKAAEVPVPDGLGRIVSAVATPDQVVSLLERNWPATAKKSVTSKELEEALLNGLLSSVSGDAHLVIEKERKVQEQSEGNRYVGIHVALSMNDAEKRPTIHQLIEGGPADRAGVKQSDLIDQIDGVDTKGKSLRDVIDRLRGDEGTSVTIKVRQPGTDSSRTYTITRGQHARPTIKGWRKQAADNWDFRMSESDPIAYIQISELAGSTPHELRKLATRLEKESFRGIVLDLRGLWSHSAHTAVLLADSLLEHGTIGRVRSSHGETSYQADSDAIFRKWPIVVLVDNNTSGASEWLAAALQDNKRGIVVGAPTASAVVEPGFAVVNSAFPVANTEWAITLSTGILERGNGNPLSSFDRSISTMLREPKGKKFGVHPDQVIAQRSRVEGPAARAPQDRVRTEPDAAERKGLEILRRLVEII